MLQERGRQILNCAGYVAHFLTYLFISCKLQDFLLRLDQCLKVLIGMNWCFLNLSSRRYWLQVFLWFRCLSVSKTQADTAPDRHLHDYLLLVGHAVEERQLSGSCFRSFRWVIMTTLGEQSWASCQIYQSAYQRSTFCTSSEISSLVPESSSHSNTGSVNEHKYVYFLD